MNVQFGYSVAASDGGIFSYDAPFFGSMGGKPLVQPIVGIAADPRTGGYWEVASDGGLFAFNAPFFGSMGGSPQRARCRHGGHSGRARLLGGGVRRRHVQLGDAKLYGSMGGKPLNKPVVGIATTPDGLGYWEVATDGGIFNFGDAAFLGSMGGKPLNKPVVGITGDQATGGYWEVASDGGLFADNAPFFGSPASMPLNKPVVGMASTPDGQGYWETATDGGIFNYGDASSGAPLDPSRSTSPWLGSPAATRRGKPLPASRLCPRREIPGRGSPPLIPTVSRISEWPRPQSPDSSPSSIPPPPPSPSGGPPPTTWRSRGAASSPRAPRPRWHTSHRRLSRSAGRPVTRSALAYESA